MDREKVKQKEKERLRKLDDPNTKKDEVKRLISEERTRYEAEAEYLVSKYGSPQQAALIVLIQIRDSL